MINLLKEVWFKWRAGVLLARVEACGYERISLKEKQLVLKRKSEEYFAAAKAVRKLREE